MGNRICPICQSKSDAAVCPVDGVSTVAYEPSEGARKVDPLLGRVFEGRYRIDARLGRGGMGTVYRAQQMVVNRPVALKVLHGHNAADEREVARFRQEARAVATLRHPHTVTLIDYGETEDGVFFLVMELIDGRTLRDVIAEEAPISVSRATHIIAQIAESLAEAHASGIVHRDLKPSNVLVTEVVGQVDYVKVVDFGIAKVTGPAAAPIQLTGTGLAIGSPRFMSPEQVSAMPVSAQSDLYALGAIFYELVTGRPLFPYTEPTPYLIAHLNEQPQWPSLDGSLLRGGGVEVCMACLSKLPSERPQDALELLSRLQEAAAESLLESMAPLVESAGVNPESELPTTALQAVYERETQTDGSGELDSTLPTTRRERVPVDGESILLPGQHLAVSSSPTLFDQGQVALREVERSELVTLLETGAPAGPRQQLQTGFPGASDSYEEASSRAQDAPRRVWRRTSQLVGVLAVFIASWVLVEESPDVPLASPSISRSVNQAEPIVGSHEPPSSRPSAVLRPAQELGQVSGVLVNSRPEGARVHVDGRLVGETPFRLSTAASVKTLSLKLEGYFEAIIDVRELHQTDTVIARLRARH